MQLLKRVVGILMIPLILTGCYPKEEGSVGEFDVVITAYDSTYIFSNISTYFMADTVIAITDPGNPENNFTYGHQYDSTILAELSSQLNSLGYQRIYDTVLTKPDVAVMVHVNATTGNAYTYYPWLAPYSFAIGTVITTMHDLRSPVTGSDTLKVVWLGAINGVAQGSNIEQRIRQGIRQLFIQSPYL
jgi:hypothetical protein